MTEIEKSRKKAKHTSTECESFVGLNNRSNEYVPGDLLVCICLAISITFAK